MASPSARSAAPTVSAARPMAMSSWTRCHRWAWLPGRAERDGGRLVEEEAGELAGRVQRGHELDGGAGGGGGRLEQVRAHALLAAGDDDDPVRGVPVHHEGLLAGQHPLRRLAAGAGAHGGERLAVALLAEGDGAAAGAGRQVGEELGRRPAHGRPAWPPRRRRRTARAAGGGPSARGRCRSRAGRRRCRRARRGRGGSVQPRSTSVDHSAGVMPVGSSASSRNSCGLHSRSSAVRATSWSASCSSSYVKSTVLPWSSATAALLVRARRMPARQQRNACHERRRQRAAVP